MLLAIGGPTGTGKSAAALDIAEELSRRGTAAEVVNADAMQLYRGMDIGTAKLALAERRGVPHHMLDVLDVTEQASVAAYQQQARRHIESIAARGRIPILVGGTGLYMHSVLYRMAFPGTDREIREYWEAQRDDIGSSRLHLVLRQRDPAAAAAIAPSDGRRIVRALEVGDLTGRRFSEFTAWANTPWCEARVLVMDQPQDALAETLHRRAEDMWDRGVLAETRMLVRRGLIRESTAGKAIGYAQALAVLAGTLTEAAARAETARATVRYARRQRTWFRRYRHAQWLEYVQLDPAAQADAVLSALP
ncbi:MAG TPA: tRNA (adenosine(37)-N6)-dimethylallyltransferase MiaA [Pseudoclavibacter sp.]|nr:tRNA (adenosine(37)-N6)-dimethylallyltransferase MiaA [Pseudoclavibacter sp.]